MKQILLATHGYFGRGIKSSLEIIVGKQDHLRTIDAYVDDLNFDEELENYLSSIDLSDDTLIILTDLYGGSVNQKILNRLQDKENVHIITGLNLPLLLELQMLTEEACTKENISMIVENSKQQIRYVEIEEDDGDDFDF